MRVCAVNGSPRGKRGNTWRILNALKTGLVQGGASVQIINLNEKKIDMCVGCLRCWDKYKGGEIKCILNDDVSRILEELLGSDMILFGTPLYYEMVTGLLKLFLERMVMLHNADIIQRGGIYTHDIALPVPPLAFVCSCDLPGLHNFEIVSAYMNRVAFDLKTRLVAEIYQCEARLMRWPETAAQIIVAAQEEIWVRAGKELAETGALSEHTDRLLRVPMVAYAHYIQTARELAVQTKEKARLNIDDGYGSY